MFRFYLLCTAVVFPKAEGVEEMGTASRLVEAGWNEVKSWGGCGGVFLYISNWGWERKCHPAPPNSGFLLGAWEGKEKSREFFRT